MGGQSMGVGHHVPADRGQAMRKQTPEGAVKSGICQLLDIYRIPYHRLNAGVMMAEHNGKRRAVRMAAAGTADLLALVQQPGAPRFVVPLYIEVKRQKGGVQSDAQKDFQRTVEAQG